MQNNDFTGGQTSNTMPWGMRHQQPPKWGNGMESVPTLDLITSLGSDLNSAEWCTTHRCSSSRRWVSETVKMPFDHFGNAKYPWWVPYTAKALPATENCYLTPL